MSKSAVSIDGSYLEGGGQILRNAAALSCLFQQPILVNNIRAGRSNPGLRAQHLTGLTFLNHLCHGKLDNAVQGSTEVTFYPDVIKSGDFMADTKTAGSVCLLLQAGLPCLMFAQGPTTVTLKGGTNADMAPQIDYMMMVLKPILQEKFKTEFHCDIVKRGYYPRGGGEVFISVQPIKSLPFITLTNRGDVTRITGRAFVAGALALGFAQQMAQTASTAIKKSYRNVPCEIEAVKDTNAVGTATGIVIVAETTTGCRIAGEALGKKGAPAEQVGQSAAQSLLWNLSHGGCVDQYLQDQLIIFMALAKGKSQVRCGEITQHTQTAIYVAELLCSAKFQVKPQENGTNIIECQGVGLVNPAL